MLSEPKSIEIASNDFESTGTIMMGALILKLSLILVAFAYASTMFCLAVSAAAALASAMARWAAWKLSKKLYESKMKVNYGLLKTSWTTVFTYQNWVDKPIKEYYLNTSHGHIYFHIIRVIDRSFVKIIQNDLACNSIATNHRYDLKVKLSFLLVGKNNRYDELTVGWIVSGFMSVMIMSCNFTDTSV